MTATPELTGHHFGSLTPEPDLPLLVLGPSLGTSSHALWNQAALLLSGRFQLLGWDLPGHGDSPAARAPFSIADLATSVLSLADDALAARGEPGGSFLYAGVSAGGATGLQLLLDHPGRITAAAVVCSGAVIGTPQGWAERAQTVRTGGTAAIVEGSIKRWFAPGFTEQEPAVASTLVQSLRDTDRFSYAWVCEALAGFDVRDRLAQIDVPVLAIAGAHDGVTPPDSARQIADGVTAGRVTVLPGVSHLAPAEDPATVAALLAQLGASTTHAPAPGPGPGPAEEPSGRTEQQVYDDGMRVRREVLGDAHVDRATAGANALTGDFQEFITRYAWGSIWTRPGLDRRSRSIVTLTALVARGHHEELAMHLRAARTNGLSTDEIKEVLLQCAIYCGVPEANTAFRIAQQVLAEQDSAPDPAAEQ
jgi:3-oxoadipate enol-lactonase/4-carboxymuconolactone decarboxylase